MSYSQYRLLLRSMTKEELKVEIDRLISAKQKATNRRTRAAYSTMLMCAQTQHANKAGL